MKSVLPLLLLSLLSGVPRAVAGPHDGGSASETRKPISDKRLVNTAFFWDSRGYGELKPFYGLPLPGGFHFFGFTKLMGTADDSRELQVFLRKRA